MGEQEKIKRERDLTARRIRDIKAGKLGVRGLEAEELIISELLALWARTIAYPIVFASGDHKAISAYQAIAKMRGIDDEFKDIRKYRKNALIRDAIEKRIRGRS